MKLNQIIHRSGVAGVALLTLVNTASFGADYPTSVLAEAPLAYWRFNETTPSPALNQVTNLGTLGAIGNANIVLDVGKGEPGILGNAIRLVNVGNVVGYCGSKVDVPYNAALNPNGPFTVEFWAKPNSFGTDATGFGVACSMNPNFSGGNRSGWLLYLNNAGRWTFRMGNENGYAGICDATTGNATAGAWQHMAFTWDGRTMRIHANGTLIGSLELTDAQIASWRPNTQMALRMGGTSLTGTLSDGPAVSASGISGNRGYDGWLDEFAVYAKALDTATIAAHYSAATTNAAGYGAQILADAPAGYWNMNEPAFTPPDPSNLPVAANSGSLGAEADGTNQFGVLAALDALPYAGFGTGNKASFLDGTSGFLSLGNPGGLNITGNITMMAWIKPQVKDFFRDIIAHGWNADYAETFLRISRGPGPSFYGEGNNYEVGVTDGSGYYDSALFPIPEGDINNWVFIAGTYDGTQWRLYRNGVEVASIESSNGALALDNRWSVGSRSDHNVAEGCYFGGFMDEPAIFNRALSAATIAALYNAAQVPPVITRAVEAPANVFKGDNLNLSVWAEGSPTLGYQWTSNGVFLGVTATNLTINSVGTGNTTIAVIITNAYGSITSSVTRNIIVAPPTIITAPKAIARFADLPFTFSVAASGTAPITYQWKRDGVDIPGANSPNYSAVANAALDGDYSVTVSNEAGVTNSTPVTFTAVPAPTGYGAAILTDSPMAYWRLGETNGTVAYDYVGSHDGTYINTLLGQEGYASVLDPDKAVSFSGVNSYIGISPTEINFTGTGVSFTLECWANGPEALPTESTLIAKGTGGDGTTASEQFSLDVSNGRYRFFVRRGDGANNLYEAVADIGPNGTWQHVVGVYDATIPDSPAQMYIYVNGILAGSAGGRPGGPIPNTSPVSIGSKRLGNSPDYAGTFTGLIDEVAVYPVPLSEATIAAHFGAAFGDSSAPEIFLQPNPTTNYVGLPATFSAGAGGTVPLTYQWRKDGVDIPGANSYRLTFETLVPDDAAEYTAVIVNSIGSITSAPVTLTVLATPTAPVAIPGLVIHLPFDGNLTDTTGRGNDGTSIHIVGTVSNTAPATYVAGILGQALTYQSDMGSFPGPTQTNTSYVTLGVRPDLQFGTNTDFSMALWIKLPQDFIGGDLPFFTTAIGSTFSSGIVLAPSYGGGATASDAGTREGCWAMSVFDGTVGVGYYGYADIGPNWGYIGDGNWHHLVYVVDRDAGLTTYLNGRAILGERVQGTSVADAVNIDTGNPATIGQDPTGTYGETGAGSIDDFGVWRRALTPLEAASIFVAGRVGLSFEYVEPPDLPVMTLGKDGADWKITFTGTLQSSGTANTGYTDVPGATSPYTLPTGTGAAQFYRARN